ncbi:MAG: PBP1A family penicillin-binding protein [Pseudomonadota bacterium]|nr:peptidase [Gammaproteobacteria bacterium]MBJ55039.1 peptidase [Gammaproteobacteria bacterium]MEC8860869.1 PBP1A family penicillin-binding protein [Pseudomonadota bacterium]
MKKLVKFLFLFGVFCACGIFMVAAAGYLYLAPQLPPAETYRNVQLETPLRILTADGMLIEEIGVRRDPLRYEDIPPMMVNALIANEDERFYSHPGVDLRGLIRGFIGFVTGVNRGGGSTITMQLANNISFDSDSVYSRKLKEIPFALRLQQELTKEEILELYLNLVFFGQGAEGIGAAAAVYYDKQVSEMTIGEMATMVSLLPCPSVCNPVSSPDRAERRRNNVIDKMRDQGMITAAEHAAAIAEPIQASRHTRNAEVSAPYVAEMVRQELFEQYGDEIYRMGIEVTTSVRGELQRAATSALQNGLENYYDRRHGYRGPEAHIPPVGDDPIERWQSELNVVPTLGNHEPAFVTRVRERAIDVLRRDGSIATIEWPGLEWARPFITRNNAWPPPQQASDIVEVGDRIRIRVGPDGNWQLGQVPEVQGAIVSVSPHTGDILALTGGYDFRHSQVNRALASRPPGSGFKAFLYGAALEAGYTPATLINDAPFARGDYRPQNYERNFVGPITLRTAIKDSRNVPAVRLIDQLGWEKVIDFADRFGFDTRNFPRGDLTIALGSQDVQPLEMATGYAMIANGAKPLTPTLIKKIETFDGVLYEAPEPCLDCDVEPVTDPRVTYILSTLLRSVVVEGSGRRVNRDMGRSDLMGKTGTTNGPAELWFTGFNADIATSVFVGLDQPEPLGESEQGATVAVPIWIDYMSIALQGQPERGVTRPEGLVDILIDEDSGQVARPGQANTMFEVFLAENAPSVRDTPRQPERVEERNNEDTLSTEIIF